MTYCYLRVSSDEQDVKSQQIGVDEFLKKNQWTCDKWYVDEGVSGGIDWRKRKVATMVKDAKAGDVLVFAEISRIGRKLVDVLEVIKTCSERGVKIYTVKDRYTLEDSIQSKVLVTVMGLAAEIERDLIRQRTKEGLKRARAAGKILGRPRGSKSSIRKLDSHAEVIRNGILYGEGVSAIAKKIKVHRNTVARYIRDRMYDDSAVIEAINSKAENTRRARMAAALAVDERKKEGQTA